MNAWLARIDDAGAYSRSGWIARLNAWLDGMDRPPSWKLTPALLATALSEYPERDVDFSPIHVRAFVEKVLKAHDAAGSGHLLPMPRHRDPATFPLTERARVLFDLARRYQLFAYLSDADYAAKLDRAGVDAASGPNFRRDVQLARLWDGIGAQKEHFAIQEIAKRLLDGGWMAA